MISRRRLVEALTHQGVPDWVVIERAQERALVDEAPPLRRHERHTRWTVIVHHDVPKGRGTARLELATIEGDAEDLVEQAMALAARAVGPAWRAPPHAAPAKVEVLDPALAQAELAAAAAAALAAVRRPIGSTVQAALEVLREEVTVQAFGGFSTRWVASALRARALVIVGDHSLELDREARRVADLDLDAALAAAATDLTVLATAGPPTPGRCAVVLRADAFLHGGGLGVWSVFADHATAEVERQGLLRYRRSAPIVPGADQLPEPLAITSDGALDFATRSVPVGDDGDAVRRFALIAGGIAVGLGTSMREAARRQVEPNGGVRNLVVASGTWDGSLATGRTIDVRRLRSLSIDPYTGDASLEISLAIERNGDTERAITGGTIRLDLVAALASARRSATPLRRGPYLGPTALLVEDAELLG